MDVSNEAASLTQAEVHNAIQEILAGPAYQLAESKWLEGWQKFLDWLRSLLAGPAEELRSSPPWVTHAVIIVLSLVLLLLLVHMAYTFFQVVRNPSQKKTRGLSSLSSKDDPWDEKSLEKRMRDCLEQGDSVEALRSLFLYFLVRFNLLEKTSHQTPRECARLVKRLHLKLDLMPLVRALERSFFGRQSLSEVELKALWKNYEEHLNSVA
jgi:hypothetical protein